MLRKPSLSIGNSPLDRNKDGPLVKYTITNSLHSLVPHCQLMFPKIPQFSQIIWAFLCVYIHSYSQPFLPTHLQTPAFSCAFVDFFCPSPLRLAPIEEKKKKKELVWVSPPSLCSHDNKIYVGPPNSSWSKEGAKVVNNEGNPNPLFMFSCRESR